jgi:hypothetical protein
MITQAGIAGRGAGGAAGAGRPGSARGADRGRLGPRLFKLGCVFESEAAGAMHLPRERALRSPGSPPRVASDQPSLI